MSEGGGSWQRQFVEFVDSRRVLVIVVTKEGY